VTTTKRKRKTIERPAELLFWLADGALMGFKPRVPPEVEVSLGRTDSKRALGFVVSRGDVMMDFVLDKDQVVELAAYLELALPRLLEPRGRKLDQQISLAANLAARSKAIGRGRP
jgi:hypothetical protein